jgi:hypothetical protein
VASYPHRHEVRVDPYDWVQCGLILLDLLGCPEGSRVPLAPDHGSKALRSDSAEGGFQLARRAVVSALTGSVALDGVPQIMRLPSSPSLVVGDVGACVDGFAIGGDHTMLRAWFVGGVCRSGSLLLLSGWRAIVDVGDSALGCMSSG